jgi:putative alpha-1,2-mannosidase
MPALIALLGGKAAAEARLDTFFFGKPKIVGNAPPDVTGLIGTYAQGNEPSHHIPYIYNYVGKPEKCAALCKRICQTFYTDKKDGIIGNDDCGHMSAWYIWNAMGMYPLDPVGGTFQLACPLYRKLDWTLSNGKIVSIEHKKGKNAKPIWSWNGKPITNYEVTRAELLQGGKLLCISSLAP